MSDVQLIPISKLADANQNLADNTYLIISEQSTITNEQLISKKLKIGDFKTYLQADTNLLIKQESLNAIMPALSGAISTVTQQLLTPHTVAVVNRDGYLTNSTITTEELESLSACDINISVTFTQISSIIDSKIQNLNLSVSNLKSVSDSLEDSIINRVQALSNELLTQSENENEQGIIVKLSAQIQADINAYKEQHDEDIDAISAALRNLSTEYNTALNTISTLYSSQIDNLSSTVQSNYNTIKYILDTCEIGINILKLEYNNNEWTTSLFFDGTGGNSNSGNEVQAALFYVDGETPEENKSYLYLGFGFELTDGNNKNFDVQLSTSSDTTSQFQFEIDTDNTSQSKITMPDGITTINGHGFEELMFLNIN